MPPDEKPKNGNGKHPGGRPRKFTPAVKAAAIELCLQGFPDHAIAEKLAVDRHTLHRATKADPEFCAALKERREMWARDVEWALVQQARGLYRQRPDCLPINVTAGIFTLKKLIPEIYSDALPAGGVGALSIKQLFDAVKDE